jgi:hypothetical protein
MVHLISILIASTSLSTNQIKANYTVYLSSQRMIHLAFEPQTNTVADDGYIKTNPHQCFELGNVELCN